MVMPVVLYRSLFSSTHVNLSETSQFTSMSKSWRGYGMVFLFFSGREGLGDLVVEIEREVLRLWNWMW